MGLFGYQQRAKTLSDKAMYSSYLFNGMPIATYQNLTADLMDGYMSNETVYAIIQKIVGTATLPKLKLYSKDGREVRKHWAYRLIVEPNADNTFSEWYKSVLIYYLAIGNGYAYAPKLGNGASRELHTLPADYVAAVSGGWSEPIRGYKLYLGNQEVELPKADVLHLKMFNPQFVDGQFVYGLSPIKVAADIINNLNSGEKRMADMLEKGTPPFIISAKTNEGLTEQQQQSLEKAYEKKYGQSGDSMKPLMSGVELKVDKLGFSAADLSLLENSQYGQRVLCNVYGVPSVLLNDTVVSTYDNMRTAQVDFIENTIKPLNSYFAEKLTVFLLGDTDYYYDFDYSEVAALVETKAELMKAYGDISYLTNNEKRAVFGYPPVADDKLGGANTNGNENVEEGGDNEEANM